MARLEAMDRLSLLAGASPIRHESPHIPDFPGREEAAARLLASDEYARADVIFVSPDISTGDVAEVAHAAGKSVAMASGALLQGFIRYLGRNRYKPVSLRELQGRGAFQLLVTGSVAVNMAGQRLGKGAGYFDLEHALFSEFGLVGPDSVVVTLVHEVQTLTYEWPASPQDAAVQVIITPSETLFTGAKPRRTSVRWDDLQSERLDLAPVRELRERSVEWRS